MTNPFSGAAMAMGYANARPPVHRTILQRALRGTAPFPLCLDVGCGAGVSTRALAGFVHKRVGLEPSEIMLRHAGNVDPGALFVAGAAERLPLASCSADLITAAGSLNYVDLTLFFREALRVLSARGFLLVYDFSSGHDESGWFASFVARYPWPRSEAQTLNPEILGSMDSGFALGAHEELDLSMEMTREAYLEYMLTETNVAAAVRAGESAAGIRKWCAETLGEQWKNGPHAIDFSGYYACLTVR